MYYSLSFIAASRLATSRVSSLRNPSSSECQRKLPTDLSAAIVRIRAESVVFKTIRLGTDYVSVSVLIGTRIISRPVRSIKCAN